MISALVLNSIMFSVAALIVSNVVIAAVYICGIICTEFTSKQEIVIAGLFPMSNSIKEGEIGRGVRPAVDLALKMINKDETLLPHHNLTLIANDTQVSSQLTQNAE